MVLVDELTVLVEVEVELVEAVELDVELVELDELVDLVDELELVELVVVVVVPPQATEKLVPSLETAEGCASTEPEPDTIVISCTAEPKEPSVPVTPLTVA